MIRTMFLYHKNELFLFGGNAKRRELRGRVGFAVLGHGSPFASEAEFIQRLGLKPTRFLPGMRESAGKSCRTAYVSESIPT